MTTCRYDGHITGEGNADVRRRLVAPSKAFRIFLEICVTFILPFPVVSLFTSSLTPCETADCLCWFWTLVHMVFSLSVGTVPIVLWHGPGMKSPIPRNRRITAVSLTVAVGAYLLVYAILLFFFSFYLAIGLSGVSP